MHRAGNCKGWGKTPVPINNSPNNHIDGLFEFIASVDSKTFEQLGEFEARELYLALDAKLFSNLVEAVSGKANLKHAQAIEIEVVLGKG